MSDSQDFAGKNGYVWFVGVVEARDDPLKLGRLRIRIIGWHDEDTNKLPTEKLPWAQISVSINAPRIFSLPKEGEWVHGYFLDGNAGQSPLVTGLIPGVVAKTAKTPNGATDVLAALEAQLVVEQQKLDAMLAGQVDASQKQKITQKNADIVILENKLTDAKIIRDRVQAQFDVATSYAKSSIALSLDKQKIIIADLEAQLLAAKYELSQLSTSYSPKQIEAQRKIVTDLKDNILLLQVKLSEKSPYGFQDTRPYSEVNTGPVTPEGVVTDTAGLPSFPRLAIEIIDKTGIDIANANKEHVCDFSMYVRANMAAARIGTGQIAETIRAAIELVLDALAPSPGASSIAAQIRALAQQIKRIADMLSEINDFIDVFTTYVQKINQLIQYILSLPEKLLAMFKDCLSQAYAELAEGLRLIISDFSGAGGESNQFSEITDAVKEAMTASKSLLVNGAKLYAAPAKVLGALTNPTKPLTSAEAKKLITGLFPDSTEHDKTTYTGALV